MGRIRRALLSVSDKHAITELGKELKGFGVEIFSTGGTAERLRRAGIEVTEVAEYTGFPEMLDGRVKTLHPKVHGGILAIRDNQVHLATCEEHGIKLIDLVAVNLYPFRAAVNNPDCTLAIAIENIDIGGPAMIRSAAKNNQDVTVIVEPEDYFFVLKEMAETGGIVSRSTNLRLAIKAFKHTASYDEAIHEYLGRKFGAAAGMAMGGDVA